MLETIILVVALLNQRTRPYVHTFNFYNKISFFVCRNDTEFATLLIFFPLLGSSFGFCILQILPQCDVVQVVCCSGFTKVLSTLFLEVFRENFDD
jgi:hypothetical protein